MCERERARARTSVNSTTVLLPMYYCTTICTHLPCIATKTIPSMLPPIGAKYPTSIYTAMTTHTHTHTHKHTQTQQLSTYVSFLDSLVRCVLIQCMHNECIRTNKLRFHYRLTVLETRTHTVCVYMHGHVLSKPTPNIVLTLLRLSERASTRQVAST